VAGVSDSQAHFDGKIVHYTKGQILEPGGFHDAPAAFGIEETGWYRWEYDPRYAAMSANTRPRDPWSLVGPLRHRDPAKYIGKAGSAEYALNFRGDLIYRFWEVEGDPWRIAS
jgi:hypothetical protein